MPEKNSVGDPFHLRSAHLFSRPGRWGLAGLYVADVLEDKAVDPYVGATLAVPRPQHARPQRSGLFFGNFSGHADGERRGLDRIGG